MKDFVRRITEVAGEYKIVTYMPRKHSICKYYGEKIGDANQGCCGGRIKMRSIHICNGPSSKDILDIRNCNKCKFFKKD